MSKLNYLSLIFITIATIEKLSYGAPSCQSFDDPHMVTFDGSPYEFQLTGDHYIMYDDFKDTRITASYQPCGLGATCNCAVYLKKKRTIAFVDFCSVQDNLSPTSQLYGVKVEEKNVGINAIQAMPLCTVISANEENNELVWKNTTLFLDNFKCAQVQSGPNLDSYVIRTVEEDFKESVKLKIFLFTRNMPKILIEPSLSSYKNTGGLCGLWDDQNNIENELYVMDANGLQKFLPSFTSIEKLAEFWKLNSLFNKNLNNKRCPECHLMSERSFYCPCDSFNLFNNSNYNLVEPFRQSFCNVPMHICIEQLANIEIPNPPVIPPIVQQNITLTYEEALQICLQALLNNTSLNLLIQNGFFNYNYTVHICALDLINTGNINITDVHINVGITEGIQNIINGLHNQTNNTEIINIINQLCPNNCNNNGICQIESDCLEPGNQNCRYPVKCQCFENYGGFDCGLDLTETPNITLDKECCDARNQDCSRINIYGFPFSKVNKMYVKYELVETRNSSSNILFEETIIGTTLSQNNIQIRIQNLEFFTLYKNIRNKEKIIDDSMPFVNIYISYINSTFKTQTSMKLYDSKCNDCNRNIKPNKCYINGICYDKNEPNYFNEEFICDDNTFIVNPDLCPSDSHHWTEWFNEDKPDGDGDIETFILNPNLSCRDPIKIQIQTVTGESVSIAGQVVQNSSCYGFICLNSQQKNNETCFDYQVRKCCPGSVTTVETTTTTTTSASSNETITEISTTTTESSTTSTTSYPVVTTTEIASSTTTTITQVFTTTTTTSPLPECSFYVEILNHQNKSNIVVVREEENNLKLVLAHPEENCVFTNELIVKVKTVGSTAKDNSDYLGAHYDLIFNNNNRNHEINIEIVDDDLIEPYEYFRIEVRSNDDIALINYMIVYIEDNDYDSGNKIEVFDIFEFEQASANLNPVYYDQNDQILSLSDDFSAKLAIFPGQGGINSPYDQLRIEIQVVGYDRYKLETIEINNPAECNLKTFSAGSSRQNADMFKSILLTNDSPLIDMNYLNEFTGLNQTLVNFDYLVIKFETTKDGNNPGPCELRAFGKII